MRGPWWTVNEDNPKGTSDLTEYSLQKSRCEEKQVPGSLPGYYWNHLARPRKLCTENMCELKVQEHDLN